jgi:methionyl-tRNA formyltransferase
LLGAGFEVPLVLTQPDRPAGRGLKLTESAVARVAAARGLEIAKPATLRADAPQSLLREIRPDVMVVAAYGLLLPQAVLDIPARGCLNIHASLLPRWRGAAPVQRAILAGDTRTGVCIMRMEAGLDTGPVLLCRELDIGPRDTTGTLTEGLAQAGAAAMVEVLRRLDELKPTPQPADGVTYAAKVTKADAWIDWREDAAAIDRRVRAFNPAPGAETRLAGQPLKIWTASPVVGIGEPGTILAASGSGIVIACGTGALKVTELQRAGSRRMKADEFLRGSALAPGVVMESERA